MATAARAARLGRLERPAMTGVLVREVVNYSSYWRSATFSSINSDIASTRRSHPFFSAIARRPR